MKKSLSLAVVSLAIAITGCGGGGGGEEEGGGGATSGGEIPAEYVRPIADTADATAGAVLFDQACGSCHPSDVALDGIGWTPGAVRQQVREGGDEMPPRSASRVSDEDLENILAYLLTIGTVAN